jgi:hypothetical protein
LQGGGGLEVKVKGVKITKSRVHQLLVYYGTYIYTGAPWNHRLGGRNRPDRGLALFGDGTLKDIVGQQLRISGDGQKPTQRFNIQSQVLLYHFRLHLHVTPIKL